MNSSNSKHWNDYYASKGVPSIPSQFAVFMLNEVRPGVVIDIGCGNGRDSMFFLSQDIPTIGIDGSESAVALCKKQMSRIGTSEFIHADVGGDELSKEIIALFDRWNFWGTTMIYARFFMHAITEEEETAFFRHAKAILTRAHGILAVEFRTPRDRSMEKATPDHYRRFVDPIEFGAKAASFGFHPEYFVEGQGFAKYKNDDAHTARFIFELK